MSLILIEGFDDGMSIYRGWGGSIATWITNGANGGRNAHAMKFTTSGTTTWLAKAAEEDDTWTVGFAFKWQLGSSAFEVINFMSDAVVTQHMNILNTNGVLSLRRGVTVINANMFTILINEWYYIEMSVTLHDTTGSYEVRVNGAVVASASGTDTKNAGTDAVFDGMKMTGASSTQAAYDDMYLASGDGVGVVTFLGDVAVETIRPNGNGSANAWVGSDGNSTDNYLLVDDPPPPVLTDYTQSNVVGQVDEYEFTDLVRTNGTVYGVSTTAIVVNSDSGTRAVQLVARPDVTDRLGSSESINTTHKGISKIWENNPETAAAWSIAEVNGTEFGVKVVS